MIDSTERAAAAEQTFIQNPFGTVTSKRVIIFRAKGWLSGGSREDIPLQHVTSVRLDVSRSIVIASCSFSATLPSLTQVNCYQLSSVWC